MHSKVFIVPPILFSLSFAQSDTTSCSDGTLYCCNSVVDTADKAVAPAIAIINKAIKQTLTGTVGLNCKAVDTTANGEKWSALARIFCISPSSTSSSTKKVTCCTGTNYSGLAVAGCTAAKA